MKFKILQGLLAAMILLAVLTAPASAAQASAEQAPDTGGEDVRTVPYGFDAGSYDQRNDYWHNGFKRYDIFFDRLVAEGAISAEQEAAIKSAVENAVKEARQQGTWRIDMSTILAGLVREGKLTAEQMKSVEDALRAERLETVTRRMRALLDRLVSSGTITGAQEEKILSAVADTVKSGARPDPAVLLDGLVRSGAISPEQRKAVEKALAPPRHGAHFRLKDKQTATRGVPG